MSRGRTSSGPICEVHNKVRGQIYLEEVIPGSGRWRCTSDTQCRTSQAEQTPPVDDPLRDPSKQMCSVHGKMRQIDNLQEMGGHPGNPVFECKDGFRCKLGSSSGGGPQRYYPRRDTYHGSGYRSSSNSRPYDSYEPRYREPYPSNSSRYSSYQPSHHWQPRNDASITCSIHGKRRSPSNLVQSHDGSWRCTQTTACKVG